MRSFVFALVLTAGCSVAPGVHREALDEVPADMAAPDLAPAPGACGNGNVVCAPDEICYHDTCITICGTATCWQRLQMAWGMCGG